mgnify:CR=1 FL=1
MSYKVFFLGTPEIALASLDFLKKEKRIELLGVISQPDRPAGRGKRLKSPATVTWAMENNIPTFQTENINKDFELIEKLENENPDFFIVFAFSQFLGKKILDLPKIGAFNLHTSLLPKYRGAAPIQYALLNGDRETGVTLQKMVKKMDAGDIVNTEKVEIAPDEKAFELHDKLAQISPKVLKNFINELEKGELKTTPQNELNVSFAPLIKKEMGHLKPENLSAKEAYNRLRALKPWPGVYFFLADKRVKVLEAIISDEESKVDFKMIFQNNKLLLKMKEGTLELKKLQMEGKKPMEGSLFFHGYKDKLKSKIS